MAMSVESHIEKYLASQPEPKQSEMRVLHELTLQAFPTCLLWFIDGTNSEGKVIANPNVGYGSYTINYADGTTKEFFQIGLSANKTGISVYIMGLEDKTYLTRMYGDSIGKASVTGYCIKFKTIRDINTAVLQAAIRDGFQASAST